MQKASSAKHILVYCDDDTDDLQLIRDALSPYNESIEAFLFENSREAYTFLLQLEKSGEKPCLIILDINMPVLSGKELLPILRSTSFFDNVPIVLFTTSSSQHDYRFALNYNAGFMTKPVTYSQMDVIADQFLSHCSDEVREKLNRKV